MKTDEDKTLLVELDCLLDTRIATVSSLNSRAAVDLLNKRYSERVMDDFESLTGGGVTNEQFRKKYAERDTDILKDSRPTRIIYLLQKIVMDLLNQKHCGPEVTSVTVAINIFPYKMNMSEREALITSITTMLHLDADVVIVELSLDKLTPTLLKDNWDATIIYDFNMWFTLHADELDTVTLPRNLLFAPALLISEIKDPNDLKVEGLEDVGPFALLEMSMVDRITLELLAVKEFSII